jgi:hypothetical protein
LGSKFISHHGLGDEAANEKPKRSCHDQTADRFSALLPFAPDPMKELLSANRVSLSPAVMKTGRVVHNWETEEWSVPINFTVAKLVNVSNQPISAGIRYWAESPDWRRSVLLGGRLVGPRPAVAGMWISFRDVFA